ncbi:hypothetical protein E3Q17_03893 [Wallemia mellicola]|uniref:RRM domain-containing protein n=1 Tax=Wallemia mellicola TaxID=1708541 RepID=A0A4T0RXF1_9BASI|nr:hypothetical protein E3Q24_01118 [Wallemia mellicola]TIB87974.1 hypothetical protein E3Q21_01136 [Wallemia mellicola]TIB90742.1 hypothetical protein E3Q20_01123 [Wallemia mellicola]TIB96325.1 hypothetical protein E3Q17_03893 [Wallemia mellicola]TIC08418.1 hypothetical protein E3Q15_04000 [Wallemia mellicola]
MNKVKHIQSLNEKELQLNLSDASWHDQYKHSAYVYIGGLVTGLTEGDVITILSQFGEIADINMPKDKATGKSRGFAFVMYEDQRSTVLAVDNLNGSTVLGRTLRVDHVDKYSQPKVKNEEGEMVEVDNEQLNARWTEESDKNHKDRSESESEDIEESEDPMAAYIREQQKKASKPTTSEKEERKARKAERAMKRAAKEAKESSKRRRND